MSVAFLSHDEKQKAESEQAQVIVDKLLKRAETVQKKQPKMSLRTLFRLVFAEHKVGRKTKL